MKKLISLAIAGCMTLSCWAAPNLNQFNQEQTQNIQQIVKKYLIANPTILQEMVQSLKNKRMEERLADVKKSVNIIKQNKKEFFTENESPIAGNPKGNVQLLEFFDYQCGYCKAASQSVSTLVKNNKNLKVILVDLPIFGGNSLLAAQFSIAAYKLNPKKFLAFHKKLMSTKQLDKKNILSIAAKLGYSKKKLKKLINSDQVQKIINDNKKLASIINLQGTPAFIIANKNIDKVEFFPGNLPVERLQAIISAL